MLWQDANVTSLTTLTDLSLGQETNMFTTGMHMF